MEAHEKGVKQQAVDTQFSDDGSDIETFSGNAHKRA